MLIVAGESSGDKYGAALISAYRSLDPSTTFFGIGGPAMQAEGVEMLHPMSDLSVVGLTEALAHIPRIRRIMASIAATCRNRKPRAAVLIDAPDFNLRLAGRLKTAAIPVLYYVSPTVWAWRRRRLKTIKARVDRMLLIFPFEQAIYREAGIPHVYVGHPLQDKIRPPLGKAGFIRKHGLDPHAPLIAILPGSRKNEVRRHLPILKAAALALEKDRRCQTVFIRASSLSPEDLSSDLHPEFRILAAAEDGYDAIAAADLVLSSCGTANLETALLGTPFIAFYKLSPLTFLLAKRMVKIPSVSIVNILAGEIVVPELIQNDFSLENLLAEAESLLNSGPARSRMTTHFNRIRDMIRMDNPSLRAARELAALIDRSSFG